MKEKLITLKDIANARAFAENADHCDFDIDVQYKHIVIDGKSIVGLFSLDFSQPVTVKYAGENEAFESFLSSLAADA